jgi:hypothetical protein
MAEQLFADWQLQSWFASIGMGLELHSNVRSGGLLIRQIKLSIMI